MDHKLFLIVMLQKNMQQHWIYVAQNILAQHDI